MDIFKSLRMVVLENDVAPNRNDKELNCCYGFLGKRKDFNEVHLEMGGISFSSCQAYIQSLRTAGIFPLFYFCHGRNLCYPKMGYKGIILLQHFCSETEAIIVINCKMFCSSLAEQ